MTPTMLATYCLALGMAQPVAFEGTLRPSAAWEVAAVNRRDRVARQPRRRRRRKRPRRPESPPATPKPELNLPPPPELPAGFTAVAVLPLRGFDVEPSTLLAIENALLMEIDDTPGLRAVSPRDALTDLAQYNFNPEVCDSDRVCLAKAGRYARAHRVIVAQVAGLGGTLSITLRLIDTVRRQEQGRVAEPLSDEPQARAQELHRLAVRLLRPEAFVGTLMIKTSVDEAEIYLDDRLVGTSPLKRPLTGLRAGPHILRVSKPGFADLYRFVDVVYNRASTLEIDMENSTLAEVVVEEVSRSGFGALFIDSAQPGVEIRIDGEPRARTPMTEPMERVPAGRRRISFWLGGQTHQLDAVTIEEGSRTDIRLGRDPSGALEASITQTVPLVAAVKPALDEASPVAPAPMAALAAEEKASGWRRTAGWVVAGTGLAAATAGALFSVQLQQKNSERDDLIAKANEGVDPGTFASETARLEQINRDGSNAQRNQIIAYSAGGALLVAGAALLAWDLWVGDTPDSAGSITLSPGPSGALIEWHTRW